MTIERIHEAYLNMEAMKQEAFAKGFAIAGQDNHYSSSPYPRLAHAADAFERLTKTWEYDNPAPKGMYWSHWQRRDYDYMVEPVAEIAA